MNKIARIIFLIIFPTAAAATNDTIQIPPVQFFIDSEKHLILTNGNIETIKQQSSGISHIVLDEIYALEEPVETIEYGISYNVSRLSDDTDFQLFFTSLPVISISTDSEIVDEPSVHGFFTLVEPDMQIVQSHIGIQYRGQYSQLLAKKSMEFEFWTDPSGNETHDQSLLGMVSDDDWNLQAMFNEPLRIRSKTNNDLWRSINTLHYQDLEPDAVNGVRMNYAELFINGQYRGIYCVGEKVSRKQLKLKKHNGTIRGELYKSIWWGASTYSECPPFSNNSDLWSSYEYKHPEEEIDWSNLHGHVSSVMNSTDEILFSQYHEMFVADNLVDYYILINLLRATDNGGKNLYLAKYTDTDKYFYVPWDLDGTFGIIWDGTRQNITNDLVSNELFDRLVTDCAAGGFGDKLRQKWNQLRQSAITHESLVSMFQSNYQTLLNNGVYHREALAWPEYAFDDQDITYLSDWIAERLDYLDITFNNCASMGTVRQEGIVVNLYPNPTQDALHIQLPEPGFELKLFNGIGQSVYHKSNADSNATLSLEKLAAGLYFLEINKDGYTTTRKIVRN